MASAKQAAQRKRFKAAARKCKGQSGSYRACMKRELRKS